MGQADITEAPEPSILRQEDFQSLTVVSIGTLQSFLMG